MHHLYAHQQQLVGVSVCLCVWYVGWLCCWRCSRVPGARSPSRNCKHASVQLIQELERDVCGVCVSVACTRQSGERVTDVIRITIRLRTHFSGQTRRVRIPTQKPGPPFRHRLFGSSVFTTVCLERHAPNARVLQSMQPLGVSPSPLPRASLLSPPTVPPVAERDCDESNDEKE